MSLDVYLVGEEKEVECICTCCDNHHTRKEAEGFFSANITHNLNKMASEAGIYEALWRPEEIGITRAGELVEPLKEGLKLMKDEPERFKNYDASNGWGTYEQFIPWIEEYLAACETYPFAKIEVSR